MTELTFSGMTFDLRRPIEISIPLQFNGEQPRVFGAELASRRPYQYGDFIGDTRRGGSCNVEEHRLIPHCNGTHTECVGHITDRRVAVGEILRELIFPAMLVTISPVNPPSAADGYDPKFNPGDRVIGSEALRVALSDANPDYLHGLIVRTTPNYPSKKFRDYSRVASPFFTLNAIDCLKGLDVRHLLVDTPSVDRLNDGGRLSAHHAWWDVPFGSHAVGPTDHSTRTITELIYVPDEVADGEYLVNIQIPAFVADAAPSRVWVFGRGECEREKGRPGESRM